MSAKRKGEILQVLFGVLKNAPEGLPSNQAIDITRHHMTLSDYEKGYYRSGDQVFDKKVRFATIECAKAGWLKKRTCGS
jgi:restriction system protein